MAFDHNGESQQFRRSLAEATDADMVSSPTQLLCLPDRSYRTSMTGESIAPTWSDWRGAIQVVLYGPHIRKTSLVAFVVGSVLFAINHLDVVLRGQATREVWVKATVTYLVPFCTSNIGILVATRRSRRRA